MEIEWRRHRLHDSMSLSGPHMRPFNCVKPRGRTPTKRVMGLRALCLALALLGRAAMAFPEGAAIGVSVVDSSGHPIAGVELQLRLGHTLVSHAQTDSQGHASFSALQPGRYEISAVKANFETARKPDLDLAPDVAEAPCLAAVPVDGERL